MDVPDSTQPTGQQLIDSVVQLTELPEPLIQHELTQILTQSGHQSGSLTLDELRAALLIYLDQAMQEELSADKES